MDQFVSRLRRANGKPGKGKKVSEVCKRIGISEQTFYRWHQKVGGRQPEMNLKALQNENARLKKMVAKQALDIDEATHECMVPEVVRSFTAQHVIGVR